MSRDIIRAALENYLEIVAIEDSLEAAEALRLVDDIIKGKAIVPVEPTHDMIDKKEMKRLCEAATPGPWNIGGIQPHGTHVYGAGEMGIPVSWCSTASTVGKDGSYHITSEEAESNARFIAAARSAVPKLLAENAALQARVQELEKAIVPVEPTHDMCLAGNSLLPSTINADEVWQAMIAAAQNREYYVPVALQDNKEPR